MITYEKHHSSSIDYMYRQHDENLIFGSHFHDSFEFIYVYEGEIIVYIDNMKYTITKNQGLLILPNQIHSYHTESYSKTFILIFASSYVAKFYKQALKNYSTKPYITCSLDIVKDLETEDNTFLLKSILYHFVYQYTKDSLFPRNEKYNTLLQNVLTYIEDNYMKDISLTSLANYLGYDHHYLSSLINKGLNTNFSFYLNEYRINKVCELMMDDNDTPINTLAEACGYQSLRTFNRNFLEIKKVTPKEYRQNLLKK